MKSSHRAFCRYSVLCAGLVACSGGAADPQGEAGGAAGSTSLGAGAGGTTSAGAPAAAAGTATTSGGANSAGAGTAGTSSVAGSEGGVETGGSIGTAGRAGTAGSGGASGASAGAGAAGALAGSGGSVNQGALPNVTLHLAGDSTVMTYAAGSAQEGWGQELGQYFIAKVSIDNQAIGGASVQSFYTSSRWRNIVSNLKAGDYVTATFGANDSGTVEGRHVEPPAFQTTLGQMADEVKARQATFILVTPSALQQWVGSVETNTRLAPYVAAMKALAPMKNILLDDLNARSLEYLNQIGQTAAMQIYINGDKAHFTKKGATQMAEFVAQELRRIGSPLGAYLR